MKKGNHFLCQRIPVCKDFHQKALSFGVGVDFGKVLACQHLTARQCQEEDSLIIEQVKHLDHIILAQKVLGVVILQIAMHTVEITAGRQFQQHRVR